MMQKLSVTVTAISPLCFSERRPGGQFRFSLDHVPGAVLRGAAAAILLRAGQEHDPQFQHLFGVGQPPGALFYPAYPGTHVLPHTAMSCKDNPGFRTLSGTTHGVFDTLMTQLCVEQLRPPGVLYRPYCPHEGCDPGRLEAFSGFYSLAREGYSSGSIPQRLLTRVGINRQRMAAENELLYSPMVLSEAWWHEEESVSACFVGAVWVEDHLMPVLLNTLNAVQHLGSGAARGLGQVKVECVHDKTASDAEGHLQAITQRVEDFNKAWQEQWRRVGQLCNGVPPCSQVFTINLRGDAILKEQSWLPTTVISAAMLQDRTGRTDASLALLRAYSSYDYRGGWNTGQRLPKDTEVVTKRGSVFVFRTDDYTRWLSPLAQLEIQGIGERTAEGFGEVHICEAFHVTGRDPK